MKPARFDYRRPVSVDGAVAMLSELGDEAKLLAGGQSLVAMMNFRLARPEHLVDIGGLAELDYVRRAGAGLEIGALTTHRRIETGSREVLGTEFAPLAAAMRWVGHLPIRTRGTVGGSLAHSDATAEWVLLAILLDAEIVVASVRGKRTVAASDVCFGFYSTALDTDEIIMAVRFPRPAPHLAVAEYAKRHGDFAVVAAAVDLAVDKAGAPVDDAAVALAGVAPVPQRLPEVEQEIRGVAEIDDEVIDRCARLAAEAIDPDEAAGQGRDDLDYLRGVVITEVRDALRQAAHLAGHGRRERA